MSVNANVRQAVNLCVIDAMQEFILNYDETAKVGLNDISSSDKGGKYTQREDRVVTLLIHKFHGLRKLFGIGLCFLYIFNSNLNCQAICKF
jgi:hypothetical protein